MKVKETYLGKVSITAEGKWNKTKEYERLSLVYDIATLESYISKIKVPANIEITNEDYWQPYSSFEKQLVIDYKEFQADILRRLEAQNRKIKQSRLVVADEEERDALTVDDISVGFLVYVLDTKHSYILDSIDTNNNKTWHIYDGSLLGSILWSEFNGLFPQGVADRAIADSSGNVFEDTYITRALVVNYVADQIKRYLKDNALMILDKQITPSMLSDSVMQLLGNRSITNLADEEDITSVNNLLKFKDKEYNVPNYSGLGIKYLRKNIIDGVNTLTQDMIDEDYTIYVLQYDYCLGGETITLPDNSIIFWKGGSLSEGTINLNRCRILGAYKPTDLFANSISLDGDWAQGQLFYHAMNLDEDGHFVEIVENNDYYWYWNGTKWISLGFDLSTFVTKTEYNAFKSQVNEALTSIRNRLTSVENAISGIQPGVSLEDVDAAFLGLLQKYVTNGQNVTISVSGGKLQISASGGTEIDWNEVDQHIADYISQLPSGDVPFATNNGKTAGIIKKGSGLKINDSTHVMSVDIDYIKQQISSSMQGATKNFVYTLMDKVLPVGSIILWDGDGNIPNGWAVYTEAQGRYVIGVSPTNGVGVIEEGVQNVLITTNKFKTAKSTGGAAYVQLQSQNLPAHQHLMSVVKTKIGDNGFGSVAPVSWGHGYIDNNDAIFAGKAPSITTPSSAGIYPVTDKNTNPKIVTGPNTASNSIANTAMGAVESQNHNVYISTIPPTIALHYIKRVTNSENL